MHRTKKFGTETAGSDENEHSSSMSRIESLNTELSKRSADLTVDLGISELRESKRGDKLHFYRHQVAGHYPIFWKSGVICKPIQKNELEFYKHVEENIPHLVPFIPRYLGVVTVNHYQLPPTPTDMKNDREVSKHTSETAEFNRFNQWGLRCHQKKKQALKNRSMINYIRLEDLTLPFSRPNILDLKIGTRVYGVGDDPKKVQRKIAKSAATTTKTLGLRLCGMQVYNSHDDGYTFRDKFYGRNLDENGLIHSIDEFFTNEKGHRKKILDNFITQILKLLTVISEQKSFQFFSSSLLFICEGCHPEDQKRLHGTIKNGDYDRVDLRFIDFAQAAVDTEKKGVDEGFLLGLQNIVDILRNVKEKDMTSQRSGNEPPVPVSLPNGENQGGKDTSETIEVVEKEGESV
mmetsp:Transcript_10973/g.20178  ORF Transcript_10973/g.20178 Transcript_10973/m.20178 type:complete len:405 (-) Transcript_10973:282-1496(-)|eukprot:CAMPEP_0197533510 /NCGR_PEP_ID=MMETSP1318-20131121/43720_1 /TAXON_ID=552666 /ORGANISM="Partenskyella glossopodia, Strain RCC365" /LENGTH=404 /DNA_ID=CAMNT_0043090435 /DNA_START=123 /DNA_END=1337 /DNA_ORIENTATION=+